MTLWAVMDDRGADFTTRTFDSEDAALDYASDLLSRPIGGQWIGAVGVYRRSDDGDWSNAEPWERTGWYWREAPTVGRVTLSEAIA